MRLARCTVLKGLPPQPVVKSAGKKPTPSKASKAACTPQRNEDGKKILVLLCLSLRLPSRASKHAIHKKKKGEREKTLSLKDERKKTFSLKKKSGKKIEAGF